MIGKESGQDDLAAWGIEHKAGVLDRIDEELDWRRFGKTLRKVFKDCKDGRPSYPPVMLLEGAAAPAMVRPERPHGGGGHRRPVFLSVVFGVGASRGGSGRDHDLPVSGASGGKGIGG